MSIYTKSLFASSFSLSKSAHLKGSWQSGFGGNYCGLVDDSNNPPVFGSSWSGTSASYIGNANIFTSYRVAVGMRPKRLGVGHRQRGALHAAAGPS